MIKFFHLRLAMNNLRSNKSLYVPYLLASTLIVMLFYSLRSVMFMVGESGMKGGSTLGILLELSAQICLFVSVVIVFYLNSFVMKRRKKEFGLFAILGMEKRHIAKTVTWEVIVSAAISIVLGMVSGALFSQLMFLLLSKIMHLPVKLTFTIPTGAIGLTALVFGLVFCLILIYDIISIGRTKAISLLKSPKEGEKEPKSNWLIALVGALALGSGYYLALIVEKPSDALAAFFPAVLLVIIGTYGLFLAGSIVFLKLLRSNTGFYYKPKNFVSVSGMIYRMKQNATGLANICILSTSVLVTLSSTICLFIGQEDILNNTYPRQVQNTCIWTGEDSLDTLQEAAYRQADNYGVTIENPAKFTEFSYPAMQKDGTFTQESFYSVDSNDMVMILLDEYNAITGGSYTLGDNEVLAFIPEEIQLQDTLELDYGSYVIRERIALPEFLSVKNMGDAVVAVLPEFSHMEHIYQQVEANQTGDYERKMYASFLYDVVDDKDTATWDTYYGTMRDELNETVDRLATVNSVYTARIAFYQVYGSLFFVGLFFVALFTIATVLIIYYKQVTEGFDDRERFKIMQNVGMSDKEVRSTISKQVMMVFFLPLLVAILHIVVAFPVLCKLLAMFQMTNQVLLMTCTACVVAAFAVLYFVVYRMTSQVYYRLVQVK